MPQPTILLIASDPQLIYLIRRYAERSGCRMLSAEAPDTALELMSRQAPALVLLHLAAWPHDGWPTLRRLREHSAAQAIPVAIVSPIMDEARAREEGATYWLWQPVMYDDFRAALAAAGVLPQEGAPGGA